MCHIILTQYFFEVHGFDSFTSFFQTTKLYKPITKLFAICNKEIVYIPQQILCDLKMWTYYIRTFLILFLHILDLIILFL